MADADTLAEKISAKVNSRFDTLREGLESLDGKLNLLATDTKSSQQAIGTALSDMHKKLDAVVGEVRFVKQSQERLTSEVAQLRAAGSSTALIEQRLNTLHLSGVPVQGGVNAQAMAAVVRRSLGEAGVAFSGTAMTPNAVWSLSVLKAYPNKKKPGTANAVIKVLTAEERYLLLSPQVTKNLQAKGINIGTDLTLLEIQNKNKLFTDPRFKAAYSKATDIRKAQGNSACVKRWVLDRCVLGTGNGRETVEWSVGYLQQLDDRERASAGNMSIDLVNQ